MSEISQELIEQYILIPYLVDLACAASILLMLDIWVRRRGVKGWSLVWLYLSLSSWVVALILELTASYGFLINQTKYLLSVMSTVLFVVAAFHFPRVREAFRDPKQYRLARMSLVLIVLCLSVAGWGMFVIGPYYYAGNLLDVIASTIAGVVLGWGLTYSFSRYGNWLLCGLSVSTFVLFIGKQFYFLDHARPQSGLLPVFFLVNATFLTMIFIVIATSWALSQPRVRRVGGSPSVQIVSLCFDLRGSTIWANDVLERDPNYVRTFIDELREWTWNQTSCQPQGHPKLIKFMGDGFLLIWEISGSSVVDSSNSIIELAYSLCANYQIWIKDEIFKQTFPWGVPIGIGCGVDIGHAIRLTFENGSNDYLGAPVNHSAKMQDLARPAGGVVIQAEVFGFLNDTVRQKFPMKGVMKIGNRSISVRMTEEVELG
jgi:class 3 adenylate cyclase